MDLIVAFFLVSFLIWFVLQHYSSMHDTSKNARSIYAKRGGKNSGLKVTYQASFESVWKASLDAAESTRGTVIDTIKSAGDIFVLYPWSMFGMGEHVSVFITPLGENSTEVEVVSKPILISRSYLTAVVWEAKLQKKIEEKLASR